MHRRLALSRKGFLALGASGVATAAAGALGPGLAAAAPQPPAPQGDDLGFLAFGAVAERASLRLLPQGPGHAQDSSMPASAGA